MAGNTSENRFSVTTDSDDFLFTVGSGEGYRIPRGNTGLSVAGASFPITFNSLGHPETAGSVVFTFTGESTYEVCLSPLGAVYRGTC